MPSSRETAKLIVMPHLIAYAWIATVVVPIAVAARLGVVIVHLTDCRFVRRAMCRMALRLAEATTTT